VLCGLPGSVLGAVHRRDATATEAAQVGVVTHGRSLEHLDPFRHPQPTATDLAAVAGDRSVPTGRLPFPPPVAQPLDHDATAFRRAASAGQNSSGSKSSRSMPHVPRSNCASVRHSWRRSARSVPTLGSVAASARLNRLVERMRVPGQAPRRGDRDLVQVDRVGDRLLAVRVTPDATIDDEVPLRTAGLP
jgi:hypothetical protein